MSESENTFRQQKNNWNRSFPTHNNSSNVNTNNHNATERPIFADWTDYVKTSANNLYTRLPMTNQDANSNQIQEPSWFKLSRVEKIIGFGCCLAASVLCFVICFFMFPVLALRPRKFALIWTLGSVLFVLSFGILQGPNSYLKHLLSRERILFSTIFFSSILITLYCSIILKNTILTIFASIIEFIAILYYSFSYFPFGATTVTWFTSYVVGYLGGLVGGVIL
ncbi:Got1/Sft2-like family-domain-containing protein [Scheffersomyces coipomensis]|uniref:Got1/Sft2-like family-domain-containing protein n=1 Tax=Scheffersomyces coipomensis TaxID=1788519 RepID=UPI00315C5A9A